MTSQPEAITEDELAAALARRHPDKPRDSAESLARALFADAGCCRPESLILPAGELLTPEQVAEFRERFAAAMANPGPLRVLPSDHWKDRAEAVEAKLAAVREHCQKKANWFDGMVAANRILAIIGSDEEPGDGD